MSFYNTSNNANNGGGFYQPSAQFAVPQGSMSFQNTVGSSNTGNDNNLGVAPRPLPVGILHALSTKGYAHEPPLLEEIGINFDHIITKTKMVLIPIRFGSGVPQEILNDSDLAGPLIFFLLFGLFLLMAGKVHFGYIYGVALFGTISLHNLSKLMSNNDTSIQTNLQFFNTASILGYCFFASVFPFFTGHFPWFEQHYRLCCISTICNLEYLDLVWIFKFFAPIAKCKIANCLPTVDFLQCFCPHGNFCLKGIGLGAIFVYMFF
ncbi:BEM_collapsed_G0022660.mRNA.1.CDS.1 [Saccharomyces cerevisiae]|nr:BEM_collapsed_G0022660.mRNA.1.CDS.1 [Saccharomyces cerevisiae]